MEALQGYSSDKSESDGEEGVNFEDMTAHLKPLGDKKPTVTTVALNAAPTVITKVWF